MRRDTYFIWNVMLNRKDNFDWVFQGPSKQPCGLDLKPQMPSEGPKEEKIYLDEATLITCWMLEDNNAFTRGYFPAFVFTTTPKYIIPT